MFIMLMFAALQAVQQPAASETSEAPRLRNPQAIITFQDYPTESLRRSEFGVVSTLLHVSIDGRVTSCTVTESSGFLKLDMKTCSLLKSRARFDPAKDAAGGPVAGEYRSANAWGVDEHQPRTTIDVSLQVSSVPADYRTPVKARLISDADGHISACEITATSGSNAADRAACAYVKQQLTIAAPKSMSDDVPAAAVRYLTASLSIRPVEAPARR